MCANVILCVCRHVFVCSFVCGCTCDFVCVSVCGGCGCICDFVCVFVLMCVHVCLAVYCVCVCVFVWLCVCLHVYVVVCASHRRTYSPTHHHSLSYSLETESPAGPEASVPASKILFFLTPTVTCWAICWTPPRDILKARAKPTNWSSSNNATEKSFLRPVFSH